MTGTALDWFRIHADAIGWLSSLCLGTAGAVIGFRELFLPALTQQRKKARAAEGRCASCGYACATGSVCAECGVRSESEKDATKPTLRKRWMAFGALLVIFGFHCQYSARRIKDREEGTALIPSTLLLFMADARFGEQHSLLHDVLVDRKHDLWFWQKWIGAWRESHKWTEKELADMIHTRPRWPMDARIVLKFEATQAMPPVFGDRIVDIQRAGASERPRPDENSYWHFYAADGTEEATISPAFGAHFDTKSYGWSGGPVRIISDFLVCEAMPPGKHTIRLDINIQEPDGFTVRQTVAKEIEVFEKPKHLLQGVDSPELRAALLKSLTIRAPRQRWSDTNTPTLTITFENKPFEILSTQFNQLLETGNFLDRAPALAVEIADGSRIICRSIINVPRLERADDEFLKGLVDELVAVPDRPGYCELPQSLRDRLSVRLYCSEALAARDFDASTYWRGEMIVPFHQLFVNGH